MFDHIGVGVSDLKASKAFFVQALSPLGVGVVMEVSDAAGLGQARKPALWLGTTGGKPLPPHIAFAADNRSQVDEFYRQALAAGGKDNGPPGDSASLSRELLRGLRHWAGRTQHRGSLSWSRHYLAYGYSGHSHRQEAKHIRLQCLRS